MKKRISAALLAAVMTITLVGCGGSADVPEPTVQVDVAAPITAEDCAIIISTGGDFAMRLGWPRMMAEESLFRANPENSFVMLDGSTMEVGYFRTTSTAVETPRGIRIGDSLDAILGVYGEPSEPADADRITYVNGDSLTFTMSDGVVVEISASAEGFDRASAWVLHHNGDVETVQDYEIEDLPEEPEPVPEFALPADDMLLQDQFGTEYVRLMEMKEDIEAFMGEPDAVEGDAALYLNGSLLVKYTSGVATTITTTRAGLHTPRDIHPGSSVSEIKAAYGYEFKEENGIMLYTADAAMGSMYGLAFEIEDGICHTITMTLF